LTLRTRDTTTPSVSDERGDGSSPASPSESLPQHISRRQFGREATIAAAAALSVPVLLAPHTAAAPAPSQEQKPEPLKGLSPEQVAEVDSKLADILRKYGDRFNDGQKAHLRRILAQNERLLAPVRAFRLENGDPPASVLRISFRTAGSSAEKSEG
jgi:hypothetical protein